LNNLNNVVVIDYNAGNLLSVKRALEHCGADVVVSSNPKIILNASKVVLPGVGAFSNAMRSLRDLELDKVIVEIAEKGTNLLGICLGMQMLLDYSTEFEHSEGLKLISGSVEKIGLENDGKKVLKIPHIGWNSIVKNKDSRNWEGTILEKVTTEEFFYFVHSYISIPVNPEHRLADTIYEGIALPAVIKSKNITGCQFHPEKSGLVGLKILSNFLYL